jgi:hypothetical protein
VSRICLCTGKGPFIYIFFGVPHLATCIFLFFYNEPELGVEIDPDMAFTPLPSSIGRGSNPQPSDHEPSALPLDHSFRYQRTFIEEEEHYITTTVFKTFFVHRLVKIFGCTFVFNVINILRTHFHTKAN